MNIETIIKNIEILREQIQELVTIKGVFVDDNVIKKSQELDILLNKYNEMVKKNLRETR